MKIKIIVGCLLLVHAALGITFEDAASNAGYTYSSGGYITLDSTGVDDMSGASLYTNATIFELNYNSIGSLASGDFSGLSKLYSLELQYNSLNALGADVFTGLSGLNKLWLKDNDIATMDDAAFNGLDALDTLILTGNPITNISASVFGSLYDTLTTLHLYSCKITDIEPGAFAGATNLAKLYLNYNHITHLNLDQADFPVLTRFRADGQEFTDMTTCSMRNARVSDTALSLIMNHMAVGYPDTMRLIDLSGTQITNTASLNDLQYLNTAVTLNLMGTGLTYDDLTDLMFTNANLQASGVTIAVDSDQVGQMQLAASTFGWGTTFTDSDLTYVASVLDITTAGQTVSNNTTSIAISGTNNAAITGTMGWSNALTGATGTFSAASSWTIASIDLDVGDNVITVSGTNEYADTASDSVTIVREAAVPVGYGILSISPSSADAGTSGLDVVIALDPGAMLPPSNVTPIAVRIGSLNGTAISRVNNNVYATFDILGGTAPGLYAVEVEFQAPPGQPANLVLDLQDGFEVAAMPGAPVVAITNIDEVVENTATNIFIGGTNNSYLVGSLTWTNTASGDSGTLSAGSGPSYDWQIGNVALAEGVNYITVSGTNDSGFAVGDTVRIARKPQTWPANDYVVVDTHQTDCFDNSTTVAPPAEGESFYGQDAQHEGVQPAYFISADGLTVQDFNTGLTWTRSPDWSGDGVIDINDKMTQSEASNYVATANAANFGGYSDWRLPTIKEMYSLMDFRGTDPMSDDTSTLVPFIDADFFEFAWGDTNAGERTVDSQVATSTLHVDPVMGGGVQTMPGLNIVDGRIKSYPVTKDFLVYLCRGNTSYGDNAYVDNGDGTVTDQATGLMWAQDDSGYGMLWGDALAYAQQMNASNHLGHSDWRLPNAKELQSIVDYSRAPTATGSAAIDPVFNCTTITNEGGQTDWPWYFTGTTHVQQDGGAGHAVYVCFGRATGYFGGIWEDVHGAGAQRSELKTYDTTDYTYEPNGWYFTSAPQGDAARWYNYVRLVRDAGPTVVTGDPVVTVTTADSLKLIDIPTVDIAGTNNEWVVGTMTWTNMNTGGSGTFSASNSWQVSDIPLGYWSNLIQFVGTNTLGTAATGTVTISRGAAEPGPVLYVDDTSSASQLAPDYQNGQSWTEAFASLQDALEVVTTQEIWVAEGTYYPDESLVGTPDRITTVTNNSQRSTFNLPAGIAIYGGFNGTETHRDQRDPDQYLCILSGDLDQNDTLNSDGVVDTDPLNNTTGANSYHVVTAKDIDSATPAVLDGFVITSGRATGNSQDTHGAGVYMYNCGGFILRNSTIIGNFSDDNGAGAYAENAGSFTISNAVFQTNLGYDGSGLYVKWSTPSILATTFSGNISDFGGGLCTSDADLLVRHCTFIDNVAYTGGGGAYESSSSSVYENCLFARNTCPLGGGLYDKSGATYINCTFADNASVTSGGGVYSEGGAAIRNCLFDNNTAGGIQNSLAASFASSTNTSLLEFSNIPGSGGSGAGWDGQYGSDGGGNLDLVDQIIGEGNFELGLSSAAINAGSNAYVSGWSEDLLGNARIYDGTVDMGCYEAYDDGSDSDNDGLSDYAEGVTYGSDASLADTDGDGFTDGDEVFIGSDPSSADSVFKVGIASDGSGDLRLSWPVFKSGLNYDLYGCTNLVSGEWFYVDSTTSSNILNSATNDAMFYRVDVTPNH